MIEVLPEAFVDKCEEIALDVRGELELGREDIFDPRDLADLLAIQVHTIERFRDFLPDEVRQLTELDAASFAAATVFCETRCLILVNPSQSDSEEALSIAHELAHLELEHEPTWPLFDEQGRRKRWAKDEELEAEYLAGALLIPRSAVLPVFSRLDKDPLGIAAHFGVSLSLMRRRIAASRRQTAAWTPPAYSPAGQATTTTDAFALRRSPGHYRDDGGGEPMPVGSPAG